MIQISEGTVYGEPYKAVLMPITTELQDWLIEGLGPEGSMSLSQQRWYYNDFYIWLRDEADLTAFVLRWS